MSSLRRWSKSVRALGPYLLVELLLPGGTLVALLLWLAQHARLQPHSAPSLPPGRAPHSALVHVAR